MIKMQAIGHLGRDAEKKEINGKTVINFSVAHTEKFKDAQGQQKDKTIWVECAYWTDKTGVLPYLTKGAQVYVEGQPDIRTFQTQNGQHGASITLRVGVIQLLGSSERPQQAAPAQNNDPVDDLPF